MKILDSLKAVVQKYNKKALRITLGLFIIPFMLQAGIVSVEWILDSRVSGVECYYSIQQCDGKSAVFLKFENKNAEPVKIYWRETFIIDHPDGHKVYNTPLLKELVLLPGETAEPDCEDTKQTALITHPIQASPVYKEKVIKFIFKDIKVSQ